MKRKALTPGERFVDDHGTVYEVVSNESGWAVSIDGKEHVRDLRYATRYMGPAKGNARYQTNTKIAVMELRKQGAVTKRIPAVVEPRDLVLTLVDHQASQKKAAKKTDEQDVRRRAWRDAFDELGVTTYNVDLTNKCVVLSFRQVKKILANAGVDTEGLR